MMRHTPRDEKCMTAYVTRRQNRRRSWDGTIAASPLARQYSTRPARADMAPATVPPGREVVFTKDLIPSFQLLNTVPRALLRRALCCPRRRCADTAHALVNDAPSKNICAE